MSLFYKARGNGSFALLLIRIVLGSMFLLAGAQKVFHLQDFIKEVQSMGRMNDNVAFVLAFILPFIEMIFGALYIIGLFTPVTSFFLSCLSISFLLILRTNSGELPFSYNFVFLACTIGTMFSGAGIISFDALLDRKKPERKITVTAEIKKEEPKVEEKSSSDETTIHIADDDVKSI